MPSLPSLRRHGHAQDIVGVELERVVRACWHQITSAVPTEVGTPVAMIAAWMPA
jgi:hypothetical protein